MNNEDLSSTFEEGRENMITEIKDMIEKIEKLSWQGIDVMEEIDELLDRKLKSEDKQ